MGEAKLSGNTLTGNTLAGNTLDAVQEHIIAATEKGEALEVLAGGSKRSYGRAVGAAAVLDVSGLSGIDIKQFRRLESFIRLA